MQILGKSFSRVKRRNLVSLYLKDILKKQYLQCLRQELLSLQESYSERLMSEAFHRGEEEGLAYFYKAFYPAIALFAFRYVKDRCLAEEIASEAFIKVWKMHWKLDSFNGIRAYLYKTVYRESIHAIKREKKRNEVYKNLQIKFFKC